MHLLAGGASRSPVLPPKPPPHTPLPAQRTRNPPHSSAGWQLLAGYCMDHSPHTQTELLTWGEQSEMEEEGLGAKLAPLGRRWLLRRGVNVLCLPCAKMGKSLNGVPCCAPSTTEPKGDQASRGVSLHLPGLRTRLPCWKDLHIHPLLECDAGMLGLRPCPP